MNIFSGAGKITRLFIASLTASSLAVPVLADNFMVTKHASQFYGSDYSGKMRPQAFPTTARYGNSSFMADPAARVFKFKMPGEKTAKDTLFVYMSTDAPNACAGKSYRANYGLAAAGSGVFSMPGYNVWYTRDINKVASKARWKQKSAILTQQKVPWTARKLTSSKVHLTPGVHDGQPKLLSRFTPTKTYKGYPYTMWAPDVIQGGDGRYYMFFPNQHTLGVAVSKSPLGPFTARDKKFQINGQDSGGIDPTMLSFIDKKTKKKRFFLIWKSSQEVKHLISKNPADKMSRSALRAVEMNGTFTNTIGKTFFLNGPAMAPKPRADRKGYVYLEGPYTYMRNGKVYVQWAEVVKGGYHLRLAMADSITGSFKDAGIVVPQIGHKFHGSSPTNHGSMINFKGKDYVFYHVHLNHPPLNPYTYDTAVAPLGNKKGTALEQAKYLKTFLAKDKKYRGNYHFRTPVYDLVCYTKDGKVVTNPHGYNALKTGSCKPPASKDIKVSKKAVNLSDVKGVQPYSHTPVTLNSAGDQIEYVSHGDRAVFTLSPGVNLKQFKKMSITYAADTSALGGKANVWFGAKAGKPHLTLVMNKKNGWNALVPSDKKIVPSKYQKFANKVVVEFVGPKPTTAQNKKGHLFNVSKISFHE